MDVTLTSTTLAGSVRAPPSKSYTHRALLAAGYSQQGTIKNALWSADTRATARAVSAFGGSVDQTDTTVNIDGFAGTPAVPDDVIDCANSGTTLRIATACSGLVDGMTVLTGDRSLRSRPQGPLLDALTQLGATAESTRDNGQAPLVIEGSITGGTVTIPGDVSSQFVTALLMAGAVTDEGITIELTTPLKSAPYVDITLEVLEAFGITATETAEGYHVPGGQSYTTPSNGYTVPGDFSSISYLLAAGAMAAPDGVTVHGATPTAQGDTAIVEVLAEMGAQLRWNKDAGTIDIQQSTLTGTTVDVGDTPDLLPTIAALGAVAAGTTRIQNCEHVRYKETDRVQVMANVLQQFGVSVDEHHDELVIHGQPEGLSGTTIDGHEDHRIIMAGALLGLVASGQTTITGADHVAVSFPDFFEVLQSLGGMVTFAE